MLVSTAELELVRSDFHRRRLMRLPDDGRRCPVSVGRAYRLQPRAGRAGVATITITNVVRGLLGALTRAEARREGFASIDAAQRAWATRYGCWAAETPVWAVNFALGDHAWSDTPVYLAARSLDGGADRDYTGRPDRALREGGVPVEVAIFDGAGEQARVHELAARQAPLLAQLRGLYAGVETLRDSMTSMRARNRARLIAHQLQRLAGELPVQEVVRSAELSANGLARQVAPHPPSVGTRP